MEFSALVTLGGMQAKHVSHSLKHNLLICVSRPLTGAGYVSVFVMGVDSSHVYVCVGRSYSFRPFLCGERSSGL